MTVPPSQADRLNAAIQESKLSRRDLARLLAGDDPTADDITSKKSQIAKWVRGAGIGNENADRLWHAFETVLPGRYKPNHFRKDPNAAETWSDRMREIADQAVARSQKQYWQEMQELRAELIKVQKAETKRIIAEFRRLVS